MSNLGGVSEKSCGILRSLSYIDPSTLVAIIQQSVLSPLADRQSAYVGLQKDRITGQLGKSLRN
jgi:hypothetical protein